MRRIAITGLILFSGTLSVLLIKELSADALAMLIGIGCGMLASLPVGLALLLWSNKSSDRHERAAPPREQATPPMIIVTSGAQQMPAPWGAPQGWVAPPRQFERMAMPAGYRVLGDPTSEALAGPDGPSDDDSRRWSWEEERRW